MGGVGVDTTVAVGWGNYLGSGCVMTVLYSEVQCIWDEELMTLGKIG